MKKSVNERVKEAMKEQGVDLLLITPSSDMVYLLGKCMMSDERLNVYVVPAEGRDFLFVNDVYGQEVAGWGIPETEVVTWKDGENAVSLLLEQLEKKRLPYGKIGIGASMPAGFLVPLQEAFARTRFVLHREILGRMRRYKNEQEQSLMEEACSRCTEALKAVMKAGSGWIGKTEGAFADALCREMEQRGISEAGALVCAGAHAAVPHYTGKDGIISADACLLVDFGGKYRGYCSDMSRTFYFYGGCGENDKRREFEAVYGIVLAALEAGQGAAVLGGRMEDVDNAARRVIAEAGYGEYFTHRTGHGIGIDTHEEPCAASGDKSVIEPGLAFSVEPGIYLPGKFGIRIEDQIFMTVNGAKVLHDYPRNEWLVCG